MKNAHAIVVLPAGDLELLSDSIHRHWLSRGEMSAQGTETELLATVLTLLGIPVPTTGMAALRYWGETGRRPANWMAAADPIHLEARLRDLRIRSFMRGQVAPRELSDLFDMLQEELGTGERQSFEAIELSGYVHSDRPFATAQVSAAVAAGHVPDRFPPTDGSEKSFHRILGELQMLLHDHEVNIARQAAGLPVINSLWFWGGGIAPEAEARRVPDLYSADALFNGFWASCQGGFAPFENFANCLANSPQGFVAVAPDEPLGDSLGSLKELMGIGRLRHLTLLFRDGHAASLGRFDRFRFWRRSATSPGETVNA